MLVKPTVPELLKVTKRNRYNLVIATAKRARQISNGSDVMTAEEDTSPITLAADEIKEEKVKILEDEQWEKIEEERKKLEEIKKAEEIKNIEDSKKIDDAKKIVDDVKDDETNKE